MLNQIAMLHQTKLKTHCVIMCAHFFFSPIGFQREDCGHKRRDNEEEKGRKVAGRYNICTQRVVANSRQMAIPNCKTLSK